MRYAIALMPDSTDRKPAKFALLSSDRVLPLVDGENIAGRGADCAVVVDATSVSRRHACFLVSLGVATVEDLGSRNGTFVNRVPISAVTRLNDGDEIALGKSVLKLRCLAPAPPAEFAAREVEAPSAAPNVVV